MDVILLPRERHLFAHNELRPLSRPDCLHPTVPTLTQLCLRRPQRPARACKRAFTSRNSSAASLFRQNRHLCALNALRLFLSASVAVSVHYASISSLAPQLSPEMLSASALSALLHQAAFSTQSTQDSSLADLQKEKRRIHRGGEQPRHCFE